MAGMLATFLLGWLIGAGPVDPGPSTSVESARRSAPAKSVRISRPGTPPRSVRQAALAPGDGVEPVAMEALVRPLSQTELERYLRSGLASNDQTYRELVLSQVLSQLTAENAPALVDAFKCEWYGENRNETLRRFVARWAKLDGASAMLYARMRDREERAFVYAGDSKDLIAGAVEGWASDDSEACLNYLEHLGILEDNLPAYLEGAASVAEDPEVFEAYVAGLEDEALRNKAIDAIGEGIRDNPDALLAWADRAFNMENPDASYVERVSRQLPRWLGKGPALAEWVDRHATSPLLPRIMFREAAGDWAKTDPRAAFEWASRNEFQLGDPKGCYDDIMEAWRTLDTSGHIEWLSQNLDDPRVNYERVNDAVAKWAETDPVGAPDWVTRNSSSDNVRGSASSEVVERWVLRAPNEALDWAGTLSKNPRKYAFLSAARTWPQGRLDEFASRLSSEPGAPDFDWARWELAGRYVDIDPEFALSLLGTIVDLEDRDRSLVQIAERVMKSDPAAVEAWLPGSGIPEAAQRAILEPDS